MLEHKRLELDRLSIPSGVSFRPTFGKCEITKGRPPVVLPIIEVGMIELRLPPCNPTQRKLYAIQPVTQVAYNQHCAPLTSDRDRVSCDVLVSRANLGEFKGLRLGQKINVPSLQQKFSFALACLSDDPQTFVTVRKIDDTTLELGRDPKVEGEIIVYDRAETRKIDEMAFDGSQIRIAEIECYASLGEAHPNDGTLLEELTARARSLAALQYC